MFVVYIRKASQILMYPCRNEGHVVQLSMSAEDNTSGVPELGNILQTRIMNRKNHQSKNLRNREIGFYAAITTDRKLHQNDFERHVYQ